MALATLDSYRPGWIHTPRRGPEGDLDAYQKGQQVHRRDHALEIRKEGNLERLGPVLNTLCETLWSQRHGIALHARDRQEDLRPVWASPVIRRNSCLMNW